MLNYRAWAEGFALALFAALIALSCAVDKIATLKAYIASDPVREHCVVALTQCNIANEQKGAHRVPADPRGN